MLRIVRWAGVVAVAIALAGCSDGGNADAASGPRELEYTRVSLTGQQTTALSQFAYSQMSGGKMPEDVALVVSPQPADTPKGKLLVAVSYGSCGHSLGRARLEKDTLIVEKRPPQEPGNTCAGHEELTGMLVTLPSNATIKAARVEPVQ